MKFKLIFKGEIADGHGLANVKKNMARFFKLEANKVGPIFSGKTIVMKNNADYETVLKIKAIFDKIGAVSEIKPIKTVIPSQTSQKDNLEPLQKPPVSEKKDNINSAPPQSQKEEMVVCFKCGFRQVKSRECIKCGMIFRKFQYKEEQNSRIDRREDLSSLNKLSSTTIVNNEIYDDDFLDDESDSWDLIPRVKLILLVISIVLIYQGVTESGIKTGHNNTPISVSLEELEDGVKSITDSYVKIDSNVRLYPAAVFIYTDQLFGLSGEPDNKTQIDYILYPIVTPHHPLETDVFQFSRELRKGLVNENDPVSKTKTFSVLVKTERFKRVAEIPEQNERSDSIEGTVQSDFKSLEKEGKNLIIESFPNLDTQRVFVLEENRKPLTGADSNKRVFIGVSLLIATLGWIVSSVVRKG